MRLLAGCVERSPHEIVLLAPTTSVVPDCFRRVEADPFRHRRFLHRAQALRGKTYLSDGAIEDWQVSPDGRYEQPVDRESWHVLALDECGDVCGCVRYRQHWNTSFRKLGVSESAMASSPTWGRMLETAVDRELAAARMQNMAYAEVGAWAIAPERRGTPEALRVALSAYAIAKALGGSRGITTATVRHHSSSILRRIGGRPLEIGGIELPSYYDPHYKCDMEILQFDSRAPSLAYRIWVERLRASIALAPVICAQQTLAEHKVAMRWIGSDVPYALTTPSVNTAAAG